MKRIDVLATIEWAEKAYGSLITNSQCTRRDVTRCVSAGLAQSAGIVTVLDDDGRRFVRERFREGFKLTEEGRRLLAVSGSRI